MTEPKWYVRVIGPDDLLPADSYIDAAKKAMEMNAVIVPLSIRDDIMHFAYPWRSDWKD